MSYISEVRNLCIVLPITSYKYIIEFVFKITVEIFGQKKATFCLDVHFQVHFS